MESSFGLMVAATKETGREANNTAKECMSQAKAQKSTENGKMVKESDGLEKMLAPLTSEDGYIYKFCYKIIVNERKFYALNFLFI